MTRSGQTEAFCQGGEPKAALFCAKDEETRTRKEIRMNACSSLNTPNAPIVMPIKAHINNQTLHERYNPSLA